MIIAALVVSIVAAAGSLGAVWYARRSDISAARSAAAAETMAALDAQRRHAELAPEFEIIFTAGENGVDDHGELRLTLTGPAGLDMLDEVTVVILDESGADHWAHGFPGGLGEKDALRFVWGPWEFNIGASAQVTDNRTTRPRSYSRADGQNWDRLSLVRTRPGHWMSMSPEQWQQQREGPIRLQITCQRAGEQWILLHEVQPRALPRAHSAEPWNSTAWSCPTGVSNSRRSPRSRVLATLAARYPEELRNLLEAEQVLAALA